MFFFLNSLLRTLSYGLHLSPPLSISFLPVVTLLASNPILQAIASTTPKPSFVLWDKAQRKASTVWEELAILRALQAFADKFEDKLVGKDDSVR